MKNKGTLKISVGATLMARYVEMFNQYMADELRDFNGFEALSSTLDSLEEMGARFNWAA